MKRAFIAGIQADDDNGALDNRGGVDVEPQAASISIELSANMVLAIASIGVIKTVP
ncbi:MAG: hypothetical protein H0X24_18890 [Ktedonobacterales bacterium]|nr:hypothetical protein [Ktedonobacterales bacterium]